MTNDFFKFLILQQTTNNSVQNKKHSTFENIMNTHDKYKYYNTIVTKI